MSLTFLTAIEDRGPVRLPMPSPNEPGLSDRDRRIVALASTRTYAAVAAEIGVSRGVVSGAVSRARHRPALSGFARIAHSNIVDGLSRRPSLYITHPDIRP